MLKSFYVFSQVHKGIAGFKFKIELNDIELKLPIRSNTNPIYLISNSI